MLELLLTFLILFISILVLFLIPYITHYIKIIIITVQLILSFILFSNNYYKKHSLWTDPEFNNIYKLPYAPIQKIIYNNDKINIENSYSVFSIYKTKEFSKKCFENYYVNELYECPINDIIFENEEINTHNGYTKIQIKENLFIYYTYNNKNVKLYKYNSDQSEITRTCFTEIIDYMSLELIKNREFKKLENPMKEFKKYIRYADFVCLSLLIISFFFFIPEPIEDCKWDFFKIGSFIIEIIIFILYLLRYILFRSVKNFFFDNEDLYKIKDNLEEDIKYLIYRNDTYYPKKYCNIDSFPVAFSINIFIFFVLHIIFKDKFYLKNYKREESINYENANRVKRVFFLLPFYIIYIIFLIKDKVDINEISNNYSDISFNWESSPIKSIQSSQYGKYILGNIYFEYEDEDKDKDKDEDEIKREILKWKGNSFEIEKMSLYNYFDIYNSNEGKKCGKDSFGNYLYFPDNVECPINDIFF